MKTYVFSFTMVFLILITMVASASETIKVASIFAKTGIAAAGNLTAIEGVRFAVDELNQQGGLLGKQIEIVEFDNHSTPLHSKQAAEKAVQEGVIAVFGANWSSHSLAMAKVLQQARIPMISTFSTNPNVTQVGDYIFRVCFVDSFQGQIMASFAMQDLHAKKAAMLINSSSRYSEGLADYFRKYFTAQSGKILFEDKYLEDTEDFTTYLKEIISLQPDVLFLPGHIVDSGRIIKQAREMGLTLPILGGDGWGDSMYDHGGSALHGNFFSSHWHEGITHKKSLQFIEKYQANDGKVADMGTTLAYDAVFLFADAVHRAGSLEPTKIRDALATTETFIGVTGNISFNEFGDPIKSAVILKFDKGNIVYVKTVEP